MSRPDYRNFVIRGGPPLLLLVAGYLLYFQSLSYPFQFDDRLFLEDGNVLSGNWLQFLFPPVPRALSWISFSLQVEESVAPASLRLVNVLLHGGNAVLLLLLCRRLLTGAGASAGAWFGALLFLLHPLQTEPVIYIYQRSTLLSTFFFLLSLNFALRSRWRGLDAALIPAFGVAALLSKEWTLILPPAIWLAKGLHLKRWKPDWALLTLFIASVLAALSMLVWIRSEPTLGEGASLDYAAAQVWVWWKYLRLTVLPVGQSLDPALPSPAETVPAVLPGFGLLLFFALLGWILRKHRVLLLGVLLYVLALLPTSSIVPAQDLIFEHRLYAPLIGFSIVTAGLWVLLWQRRPGERPRWVVVSVLLLATLSILTGMRSRDWSSQERIWRQAVEQAPDKYRPRLNLGRLLMDSRPAEAERQLIQAIEIRPDLPHAYRSLAALRLGNGQRQDAARLWQQALLLEPGHAATHLALGQLWMDEIRYPEAKYELEKALEADPLDPRIYRSLARLELLLGFHASARDLATRGLVLRPNDPELLQLRARALFREERWSDAAQAYETSFEVARATWENLVQAGQARQRSGDFEAAERLFRQAVASARNASQRSIAEGFLAQLPQP